MGARSRKRWRRSASACGRCPLNLPACRVVARVADKFGHVRVDRVTYSVPIRHAYRPVWAKLYHDRVAIAVGGRRGDGASRLAAAAGVAAGAGGAGEAHAQARSGMGPDAAADGDPLGRGRRARGDGRARAGVDLPPGRTSWLDGRQLDDHNLAAYLAGFRD